MEFVPIFLVFVSAIASGYVRLKVEGSFLGGGLPQLATLGHRPPKITHEENIIDDQRRLAAVEKLRSLRTEASQGRKPALSRNVTSNRKSNSVSSPENRDEPVLAYPYHIIDDQRRLAAVENLRKLRTEASQDRKPARGRNVTSNRKSNSVSSSEDRDEPVLAYPYHMPIYPIRLDGDNIVVGKPLNRFSYVSMDVPRNPIKRNINS